jgi:hypothetical protein
MDVNHGVVWCIKSRDAPYARRRSGHVITAHQLYR